MAFDISKFAKDFGVSESDTELREIPLAKIRENPENFYPPLPEDEAAALRESIQANGLLEPLLVVADGDGYRLVSGHNRLRALRALNGAALGMDYRTALCRVLPAMDEAHEVTAIIEANRQRKKTPAVLQAEAEALTAAYVKRREAGEELPGRIRDRVAEAMHVSATKLANLSAIKNGLHDPYLADLWETGQLTEACALEIVRNVHDGQQAKLAQWLRDEGEMCTLATVREYEAIHIKLEQGCMISGMPCPNARAMYKAFFRAGEWQGCAGCCGMCKRRDECSVCCEYVGTVKPDEPPEVPAEQPEPEVPAGQLDPGPPDSWHEPDAWTVPSAEPQPVGQLTISGWMPGGVTPAEPGEFAAVLDLEDAKQYQFLRWTCDGWKFLKIDAAIEVPVLWWMRLPPMGAGDAAPRCCKCWYTSDVATPFCPWCGRAATPEGMRILRGRWEALRDEA